MWSVRIDALNGKLLEKNDLVISCQFDRDIPYAHEEAGSESWFTSFDNSHKQIYSPSSNTVVGR
jgi:hypothetical protein